MSTFKIATWNLERPKMPKPGWSSVKNDRIVDILKEINADILILTETNAVINPGPEYVTCVSSNPLPVGQLYDDSIYHEGENRTTIWSKYPLKNRISTSNDDTNTCCELNTSFGNLIVYGTIIGIQGQKKPWFASDLDHVIKDTKKLSKNRNFILAGDFNLSFSDNYYPHAAAKEKLRGLFTETGMVNTTALIPGNIDHIIVSKHLQDQFDNEPVVEFMPAIDKSVSDHKWVSVTFTPAR